MAVKEILQLGNPKLYEVCSPVEENELEDLKSVVQDLQDTLFDYRKNYGASRAIAAPQIGIMKRMIYIHIDDPLLFINPVLFQKSTDMVMLWDNCMCFPDLLVKLKRHKSCKISYRDDEWNKKTELLQGNMAELLQHECDHLFGILAVARAVDGQSFSLRSELDSLRGHVVNVQ